MKFAVFDWKGGRHAGRVNEAAKVIERLDLPSDIVESDGVGGLIGRNPPAAETVPLDQVVLQAPIPRPRRNIFCVGKNYYDHAHEFASSGFDSSAAKGTVPEAPIVFTKVPESVVGPGAPIRIDGSVSTAVDYEAELTVIIGSKGRNISKADALRHVWGYTIVNDVTARDLQGLHSQWLIGKSQDTFCPMGPWAVTADEMDLSDAAVRCWVNDELRQDSNTGLLIFDVPTIIAAVSNGITLYPGDVIATGTPAGVGIGFKPPKYLVPGDRVRIEIGGIGVLENPVEAVPRVTDIRIGSMVAEDAGDGPAVVMVHGLGGSSNSFQTLIGALDGYRVLRPDLPGAGRSALRPGLPGLTGLAAAVRECLRAAGIEHAHLVGHSMGTLICQYLAADTPALALSLTLFGPILAPPPAARQALKQRAIAARSHGLAGIADAVSTGSVAAASAKANPVATAFVRESIMRQDPAGYAAHCDALSQAEAADHGAIRCPTLLVAGADDPVAPVAMATQLKEKIPGARLEIVPGIAHWMMVEAAQRSAELLCAHLEKASAS